MRALKCVTISIVARFEPRWAFCNSLARPTGEGIASFLAMTGSTKSVKKILAFAIDGFEQIAFNAKKNLEKEAPPA